MTPLNNMLSIKKIFVILNLITALLGGIYGYIYLNKSLKIEANQVLYAYKQQGFNSLKDEILALSRQSKDYQPTLNDFKQTCEFYKNVQRPLTGLAFSIKQVEILRDELLNQAIGISEACNSNNSNLAAVVMKSISEQQKIVNELGQLKKAKYVLKGTLIDRLPIHILLIIFINVLIIYLQKQKPHDWLKFSMHENLVLFIIAVFLSNTLNPLYILLIFPCIFYFGYLMILKTKHKNESY